MQKKSGMNRHQKAVYRKGEERIDRNQRTQLLEMSRSDDPDDRFCAASYLCPCHVKGHYPEVWAALYRMMEDPEVRVRHAAWHTLEDGGLPSEPETLARLEAIYERETNPKVRRFAATILGKALEEKERKARALDYLAVKPPVRQRGKCDFCGETNVFVDYQYDTQIPGEGLGRAALICDQCAATY